MATHVIWLQTVNKTVVVNIEPRIVIGIKLPIPRLICLMDIVVSPPYMYSGQQIPGSMVGISNLQSAVRPAGRALKVASSAMSANLFVPWKR